MSIHPLCCKCCDTMDDCFNLSYPFLISHFFNLPDTWVFYLDAVHLTVFFLAMRMISRSHCGHIITVAVPSGVKMKVSAWSGVLLFVPVCSALRTQKVELCNVYHAGRLTLDICESWLVCSITGTMIEHRTTLQIRAEADDRHVRQTRFLLCYWWAAYQLL